MMKPPDDFLLAILFTSFTKLELVCFTMDVKLPLLFNPTFITSDVCASKPIKSNKIDPILKYFIFFSKNWVLKFNPLFKAIFRTKNTFK